MTGTMQKKVYYHDTDCGGVVYYANYLKYFEEGRTRYLADRAIDLAVLAKDGYLFVVKKVDIEYKSPARYGDNLIIDTVLAGKRSASLTFRQTVKRGDAVLVLADTVLVCIGSDFRPAPMPGDMAARLV